MMVPPHVYLHLQRDRFAALVFPRAADFCNNVPATTNCISTGHLGSRETHMRRLLILTAALSIAVLAPRQGQAQDADCKAIIDSALKAQGGADKVQAIKATTSKWKGTFSAMGMDFDFTAEMYQQQPGKMKMVLEFSANGQKIELVQASDGKKAWRTLNGQAMAVDDADLDEFRAEMYAKNIINLTGIAEDKALKLSTLGESKVEDTPVVGVQITKKDKRDINLFFDKKSHLLIKAEYRAVDPITKMEVTREELYRDYKELVPGVKMPSKTIWNHDGKKFIDYEITEMRAVEKHDDSIFAKPPQP
jgi:hypothetical protein